MRVIKFRQLINGKFSYWGIGLDDCAFVSPSTCGSANASNTINEQFTGVKDAEGVEIYEGDILGFGDDSPENKSGMYGELGFVFMCENHAQWMVKLFYSGREVQLADHLLFSDGHTCRRVYGNIHQNPELLE